MSDEESGDTQRIEDTDLYADLHRVAALEFRRQQAGHTLQPTALVHEAWLRIGGKPSHGFESRSHFLAVAAKAMRHVLVDHARRVRTKKRGGDQRRIEIQTGMACAHDQALPDVLDLDAALERLAAVEPRQAQVVELKFFSGMTLEEISGALGVSDTIVSKDWRKARGWLARELEP
ncbi:MAG: RNA polymerase subunit sigma [Planctomycetota bacterium]|nr:MAG: RNA polymerase subunit sigma [Planctomycetota bacterium]